ncbi:MAG: diadenylate cyclase CdaA [Proteobacteria bacterium]|jgi:diadenylate cyclase|nr:diadenylate cyclase CdaA [Pseudomonadota bacterium]
MNGGFLPQLFFQLRWQDLLDVLLVYFIVYRLLLLIRGTRSVQILTGLGVLSLMYILSDRMRLYVFNYFLKQFFDYMFLIVVILFQDEIRRALANIGKNPFLSGSAAKSRLLHDIEEICRAAQSLAANRVGALIAIERQHGLKNYSEGATRLNADVSAELLYSIFQSNSPLHDGAVLIEDGRITAAGCFVPVTLEAGLEKSLGTRHRAAVGLSKETDALVVVISEERGEISLVEHGNLKKNMSAEELQKRLLKAFEISAEDRAVGLRADRAASEEAKS